MGSLLLRSLLVLVTHGSVPGQKRELGQLVQGEDLIHNPMPVSVRYLRDHHLDTGATRGSRGNAQQQRDPGRARPDPLPNSRVFVNARWGLWVAVVEFSAAEMDCQVHDEWWWHHSRYRSLLIDLSWGARHRLGARMCLRHLIQRQETADYLSLCRDLKLVVLQASNLQV